MAEIERAKLSPFPASLSPVATRPLGKTVAPTPASTPPTSPPALRPDTVSLSDEAFQPDLPMSGVLTALRQAWAPRPSAGSTSQAFPRGTSSSIHMEMARLQQQLSLAHFTGDDGCAPRLMPQLKALLSQLPPT